jgi:hypothetical protein
MARVKPFFAWTLSPIGRDAGSAQTRKRNKPLAPVREATAARREAAAMHGPSDPYRHRGGVDLIRQPSTVEALLASSVGNLHMIVCRSYE